MSRTFLYLLVDNTRQGNFALRRINMSGFFHPTKPPNGSRGGADAKHTAVGSANNRPRIEDTRLPRPVITFHPTSSDFDAGSMQFMLFNSNGKNQIIGSDRRGKVLLYNTDSHTVQVMPSLNWPKHTAISLTANDNLYVMDRFPGAQCFEALIYGHPSDKHFAAQDWYWRTLPPPPYVFEAGYKLPSSYIRSYTVVGGSSICVSAKDIGTYSFDTVSHAWSKTGDWVLPFCGRAEYVPEYNLWFGLSYVDNVLCASDLSATSELRPPVLHRVFEDDLNPPDEWVRGMSYMVHLGSGKFCIARFFQTVQEEQSEDGFVCQEYDRFAVFAGVEVERCGTAGRGLRLITHRAKRYRFVNKVCDWVF